MIPERSPAEGRLCEEDDAVRALVRTCVAVGLLIRQLPESPEALEALAIDEEVLRSAWAKELDRKLQQASGDFLAGGAYDQARQLAQTKSSYLYDSLATTIRERHARGESCATTAADETGTSEETTRVLSKAAAGTQGGARAGATGRSRWARSGCVRPLLAAIAASALAVTVYVQFFRTEPGSVHILTPEELAAYSPHLDSGYRSGRGQGPLFVATVATSWHELPTDERRTTVRSLAGELRDQGVREVLVFDVMKRMQAHVVRGDLRHLAAD